MNALSYKIKTKIEAQRDELHLPPDQQYQRAEKPAPLIWDRHGLHFGFYLYTTSQANIILHTHCKIFRRDI